MGQTFCCRFIGNDGILGEVHGKEFRGLESKVYNLARSRPTSIMLPVIDRLLVDRAENGTAQGDNQPVLDQILNALDDARSTDPAQLPILHLHLAQIYSRTGRYLEAVQHAQEVLKLDGASATTAEALLVLGICCVETNQLDQAEEAFFRAADVYRRLGHKDGLARVLHNLASGVLILRGKFNLALSTMEEAHAIRNELGLSHWGWPWLRSYVHLLRGDQRRARQALDELLNQIEPATRLAGGYYYLWARLELDEGEYEKAREYLRLGLRIATQSGVPDLSIWFRIEHSRLYRLINQHSAALEWAEDALQHAHRYRYDYFAGLCLVELAQVQIAMGDHPQSFRSIAEALDIFDRLEAAYDQAYSLYLKAVWTALLGVPEAGQAWRSAAASILHGGYTFIFEREQETAFPLIARHLHSADPLVRQAAENMLPHLAEVSPPPLRIVTLGQFAVWKGQRLIPDRAWQRRKAGELFRFLLLQPRRTAGKDAILEAIWPDTNFDTGNDILHQATSTIRRILEPDLPDKFPSRYLSYEGEQITLKLPARSMVDFEIFHQNISSMANAAKMDDMQEILRLYTGDLLPGDQFADWTAEMRTRLIELYEQGQLILAHKYFSVQQYADALDCCRHIIRRDPWNEEAVLLGMEIFLELGSAPHAMRLFSQLEQTLKDDLNIVPRSDLRALAESIRNR
jgi:LuxR family transcriptional regulator, maltose regulon positive regulatory protein